MASLLSNLATLGYNLTSTGTYTLISAVKEISSPKPEWAAVPVGTLTDVAELRLPGFVDNKEFSWIMMHNSANKALLTTLGGVLAFYEITLSDASTITFAAIFTSWEAKMARNGAIEYSCKAEISGVVTIT